MGTLFFVFVVLGKFVQVSLLSDILTEKQHRPPALRKIFIVRPDLRLRPVKL
jgi:hypothetical protein